MTEPMTARERAEQLAENYRTYTGKRLVTLAEEAILTDRAAERARLAQSGDVEGLAQWLKLTWAQCRDETGGWETLARHVQAKLAATAEAARIEARDAIADWHDAEADRLLRIQNTLPINYEGHNAIGEDACDHRQYAKDIRALRPDELEKKT